MHAHVCEFAYALDGQTKVSNSDIVHNGFHYNFLLIFWELGIVHLVPHFSILSKHRYLLSLGICEAFGILFLLEGAPNLI